MIIPCSLGERQSPLLWGKEKKSSNFLQNRYFGGGKEKEGTWEHSYMLIYALCIIDLLLIAFLS